MYGIFNFFDQRRWLTFVLAILLGLLSVIAPLTMKVSASSKSTLYHGGDILTMTGDQIEYVEAIIVQEGKIKYAGNKAAAIKWAGKSPELIDLKGKTLLPGFIDAHGHFIYQSKNLLDASLLGVKNIPELLARIKEQSKKVPEGSWIVGLGYRTNNMEEHRHPTKEELDSISTTNPIMVVDGSGHHAAINSALMKQLNLGAATPDPEGGIYYRKAGSQELDGHVAEEALNYVRAKRPAITIAQSEKGIALASKQWLENGQTTALEAGFGLGADDIDITKNAIDKNLLPIDLVLYAKGSVANDAIDAAYHVVEKYSNQKVDNTKALLSLRPDLDKRYINRVRLGGIKFWIDGSNETAWMSKPFTKLPEGVSDKNYSGVRTTPQKDLEDSLNKYWKSNIQVSAHVLGDEAVEQYLQAIEKTIKKQGMSDHRPIFIHAQFVRPDQVARIKAVGGVPSFTINALELVGDYVAALMGPERESWAAVANSMETNKIKWTSNHDMPAGVSPSLIYGVYNAVNRITTSGKVIAPQQRVTPYQALRSITINAAYEIKEEKNKGSLEVGKVADLVILDQNPLKVDPLAIKNIKVVETIKEGKTLFKKDKVSAIVPLPTEPNEAAHHHDNGNEIIMTEQDRLFLEELANRAS